ncbi:hypothetical protein [Streptomyces sp. NPDC052225]|uniref:hypothetical protein n=1 Tax=Streptomyces sp. NPDC052225 TaxID=3154949 RepID=UPI003423574F
MANTGGTPPEANFLDQVTWINKADYERTKSKAYGASTTSSGIKGDITLLKAELSGLALLSIGYSLFKIDEKGVSYRGKMIYAAKYADAAKHFQVKAERFQEKMIKAHAKLSTEVQNLQTLRGKHAEKVSAVERATAEVTQLEQNGASGEQVDAAKARLKRMREEVRTLRTDIRNAEGAANISLKAVRKLAEETKDRAAAADAEKGRLKKSSEEAIATLDNLKSSIDGVSAAAAGP